MGIEVRAGLARIIVVMRMNVTSIHLNQVVDQLQQSRLLFFGPSVYTLYFPFPSSDIAYTDGMGVVAITVCTSPGNDPTTLNSPVEPDDIMVPDISPTVTLRRFCHMPFFDFLSPDIQIIWRIRAMYDDIFYHSHITLISYQN